MQSQKQPSTKSQKKPQSDSQGLQSAKRFIEQVLRELRAGPVLSIPIRKRLADALDEGVDSRFRLVIKQKRGQPQGDLGMIFDAVRMEAAEYVAALMRYRGKNSGFEKTNGFKVAIAKGITWASEPPRNRQMKRSALIEEYKRWKNPAISPRSCEFFEGTETEAQVEERQAMEEKFSEDLNNSRDASEIEEDSRRGAQCQAQDAAGRMSARVAQGFIEEATGELSTQMTDWLRKYTPGLLKTEISATLSEQLIQGFLEEMAQRLLEDMPKRLREAISDSASPK
jgi:hypothetical protein